MKSLVGSNARLLVSARGRIVNEARDEELVIELTNAGKVFAEITSISFRLPHDRYPGNVEVPLTELLVGEPSLPHVISEGESISWCVNMHSVQEQVYMVAVAEAEMPGHRRLETLVYRLLPIALQKILRRLTEGSATIVLRDSRGKRYKAEKVQWEPRWDWT